MSSKTESSSSTLSSRTRSRRKRKRRSSNKSVSSECNTDKEEKGIRSLWYWSNYYKALIWQNRHELELWKKYALALEYEKTYLLQELQRQKELHSYENSTFKTFTQNQVYLEKSSKAKIEEDAGNEDREIESETEEDEGNEDKEIESETEEYESNGDEEIEFESEEYESNEDEEIEFEVSEEMIKFFEQSIKHKLEMRQLKEKELKQFELDVKELKEAHEMREKEMKLLYGEGSCMIIGMETAVQLSFDKYCDLKSPSYWPNIPLNL